MLERKAGKDVTKYIGRVCICVFYLFFNDMEYTTDKIHCFKRKKREKHT